MINPSNTTSITHYNHRIVRKLEHQRSNTGTRSTQDFALQSVTLQFGHDRVSKTVDSDHSKPCLCEGAGCSGVDSRFVDRNGVLQVEQHGLHYSLRFLFHHNDGIESCSHGTNSSDHQGAKRVLQAKKCKFLSNTDLRVGLGTFSASVLAHHHDFNVRSCVLHDEHAEHI